MRHRDMSRDQPWLPEQRTIGCKASLPRRLTKSDPQSGWVIHSRTGRHSGLLRRGPVARGFCPEDPSCAEGKTLIATASSAGLLARPPNEACPAGRDGRREQTEPFWRADLPSTDSHQWQRLLTGESLTVRRETRWHYISQEHPPHQWWHPLNSRTTGARICAGISIDTAGKPRIQLRWDRIGDLLGCCVRTPIVKNSRLIRAGVTAHCHWAATSCFPCIGISRLRAERAESA